MGDAMSTFATDLTEYRAMRLPDRLLYAEPGWLGRCLAHVLRVCTDSVAKERT